MNIAAFTDKLLHPAYSRDADKLRRARLFVRACLLTSFFSSTYIWLSVIFGYEKGVALMTFNMFSFLLLPLLARTSIPITWLGNIFISFGAFAVVILTYFSGGVWSAVYPWIISIPVLAMLVVNRLSGIIWGVIAFGFMIWFGGLAWTGVELPVEYNPELRTQWYVSVLPGLLLIILFIAFVFESMQSKALSQLKFKNDLLVEQKRTIAEQSRELQTLVEEKDYIIRILAHDLRSPLKNINSLLRLMEMEKDTELQKDYIGMISQASSNAGNLVNRVLEMDASDQDDKKVNPEPLNVKELITGVIGEMRDAAKLKNIRVKLKASAACDTVLADRTYLYQTFENLISNAMKFSESGKQVLVEVSDGPSSLLVKVIDEGQGVNPEEEDLLFKKFSRLSARPTAGESSTGLGLSLVKRYVELLGGKVWYENTPGGGATFIVQLPLAGSATD